MNKSSDVLISIFDNFFCGIIMAVCRKFCVIIYAIFFGFVANCQTVHETFTLDHFELIKNAQDNCFLASPLLDYDQKNFLYNIFDQGNLIRFINRYYELTDTKNLTIEQKVNQVEDILVHLFKLGTVPDEYEAINKCFSENRKFIFNALRNRISKKHKNEDRLKDKTYAKSICHTILIDQNANTGLMLAIETGNNKIFDLFLKYYLKQNCPINARNSNKKTALCIALEKGTIHMVRKLYKVNDIQTTNIDDLGSSDLIISAKRDKESGVFDFVYKKYQHNQEHLNIQRLNGYTAYLVAAEHKNTHTFNTLNNNQLVDKDLYYNTLPEIKHLRDGYILD